MRLPLPALLVLVACGGSGPEVATTSLPPGIVDEVYTAPLTAFGGEAPLRWTLAEGSVLPEGLTLNPAGAISGLPTSPTDGVVSIEVEDARGRTDVASLNLDIAYNAGVLLCDGVVEGELTEAGLDSFDLNPTIEDGVAWVSVPLPPEGVTRIDIGVGWGPLAEYGYVYFGAPGTAPGDTNLDHYVDRSFVASGGFARTDLNSIADLEAYRAHGEPITLMFGTNEASMWRLAAECTTGPIFADLTHAPTRVGDTMRTNYNVVGENAGVRIWTDDPLPDWLTWDETNGRLGGIAEEAGVWPISIHAQAEGGQRRTEQTWISTWEPVALACGDTVDFGTDEGYFQGQLSRWLDPRGYQVFETTPPSGVSLLVAQLEGPDDGVVGWAEPGVPYYSSSSMGIADGRVTLEFSPSSWPPIGSMLALGEPFYSVAYSRNRAADMRMGLSCDTSPRPDVATLPVLTGSDRIELPVIGGSGAITWEGSDLPDGVSLSEDGVLTADAPFPGRYEVSIAMEDETGQRSETPFDLDVGWDSACRSRERISCGDTVDGTFTGTIFDGEAPEPLCLVHELGEDGRVGLTLSAGEDARIAVSVLSPTVEATATNTFATDGQSSVLFVGRGAAAPLDPWLDRTMPLEVFAYGAGDWSLEISCD